MSKIDDPTTLFLGKVLIELQSIDSTNRYAQSLLAKSDPIEGSVILAQDQHGGKGQFGKTWLSAPGENLTFSIVLLPKFLSSNNYFRLNQAVCMGIHDWLVGIHPRGFTLKWPNDIYHEDKKLGGVLIENNHVGHRIQSSVVGIGINVNQVSFSNELPNPISLRQITGITYDLPTLFNDLIYHIEVHYLGIKNRRYQQMSQSYNESLHNFRKWRKFKAEGETFTGQIVGADQLGNLIIEHESGGTKAYQHQHIHYA